MVGKTLDVLHFFKSNGIEMDQMAVWIGRRHMEWQMYRKVWLNEKAELRDFIFATDSSKTVQSSLPWKNKTVIPKIAQIRDNLHANYMASLFPNERWLSWEGNDEDDEIEAKRKAIESYILTKFRQGDADVEISRLVLDFIDYGNCFAKVEWKDNSVVNPVTKEVIRGFLGPVVIRISPFDITFNPVAQTFEQSPKILRSLVNMGELKEIMEKLQDGDPQKPILQKALDKAFGLRKAVAGLDPSDIFKNEEFIIDGFSSIRHYFQSDYVEVLDFYGDVYDVYTQELKRNRHIRILDRMTVIVDEFNPNWINGPMIYHCSWRQRPDNLYGQGPLDNLVGLQYRMNHLENLKADVFDQIAFPMRKHKGFVEPYEYAPGNIIVCGDDGDVEFMHPPHEALDADNQIDVIERRMEEMAGAPKQAMGIRTPGEKTAFEVQKLDNASSRIFDSKTEYFERVFLEKIVNGMLLCARQNMDAADTIRTLDSEIDAVIFSKITKDDIVANGILHPIGARHFAYKANVLQNAIGLFNSPLGQDPAVKVHLSGKKLAKLAEELIDLDDFKIFGDNIRVFEQAETQHMTAVAQEHAQLQASTPAGILPSDQNQQLGTTIIPGEGAPETTPQPKAQ